MRPGSTDRAAGQAGTDPSGAEAHGTDAPVATTRGNGGNAGAPLDPPAAESATCVPAGTPASRASGAALTHESGARAESDAEGAADAEAQLRLGLARCGTACIGIPIENLAEGCRVGSLGALLHPAPGLLGALRLRGLLVPIFDLGAFTDRVPRRDAELPDYAVILRANQRLVGLAVDEIEGLLQARAGDVQRIRGVVPEGDRDHRQSARHAGDPGSGGAPARAALMSRIVRGSLLHGDEVISVIEPEALFACGDILSVPASRRAAAGHASGDGPPAAQGNGPVMPDGAPGIASRRPKSPPDPHDPPAEAALAPDTAPSAGAAPGSRSPGGEATATGVAGPSDTGRPVDGRQAPLGLDRIGPEQMGRGTEPLLTFSAGGASFALLATAVHATVPRTAIEQNSLSGGMCIGSISHHRQRIPVLRTETLTRLGTPSDRIESEIVLVRTGEEERIGLAVDTINRMIAAEAARLRQVPPAIAGQGGLFKGVISTSGGDEQIFVIDPARLAAHPDIAELSALSRRPRQEETRPAQRGAARSDVIAERLRHLVFDAGTSIAAPAEQIVRILTLPEAVTPTSAVTAPGVEGVFLLDGSPVLCVDLAAHLGLSSQPAAGGDGRVLLVGRGAHRVGFVVRSVDGIETSEWRREGQTGSGRIVQLGRGADRVILPAIDLHRLADGLTATPAETGS